MARYAWGPEVDGLSVGLAVERGPSGPGRSMAARLALRSEGRPRQVTAFHGLDRHPRSHFEILDPSGQVVASTVPLHESPLLGDFSRTVDLLPGQAVELDPDEHRVVGDLPPGRYQVRAVFGGEGFDFELRSGTVGVDVGGRP